MKTYQLLARLGRPLARPWHRFLPSRRRAAELATSRAGTVIIVVLALLGMLVLIGFFAFAFTASENQSATYFAGAAKVNAPSGIDPDLLFNNVLRQIIIGPSISEKQSVLWGGRSSLLPTMFGRDLAPYNGQGVNLMWNQLLNQASVDQNYDQTPDDGSSPAEPDNRALTFLNLSPAAAVAWQPNTAYVTGAFVRPNANAQTNLLYIATIPGISGAAEPAWPTAINGTVTDGTAPQVTWTAAPCLDLNNYPPSPTATPNLYPDPDLNATYPDINSPFLAYDTLIPNPTSATLLSRFITPSFHRPQYLRNATAALAAGANPVASTAWYTDPLTASRVLYPHREHTCIDSSGNITTQRRFVTAGPPTGGPFNPPYTDAVITSPFPIPGDGATSAPAEGLWTGGGTISYTVDTDGDLVPDANYIDLGFPLMTDAAGNQFVALPAIRIIDADALFNINVHGNRAGQAAVPSANNFGGPGQFLSRSNLGVSASEVNPEWAFNARPLNVNDFSGSAGALTTAMTQYVSFFRAPANSATLPADDHSAGSFELANMEWWNILNGRPQLTPSASPTTIPPTVSGSSFPGRWGENVSHLDPNVNLVLAGTTVQAGMGIPAPNRDQWPLPGTWGVDDNNNFPESGVWPDPDLGITYPAFVHPIDYFAAGFWVTNAEGKTRELIQEGQQKFPLYSNYYTNPEPNLNPPPPIFSTAGVQWTTPFSGALMVTGGTPPVLGNALALLDEPDEQWTEPALAATQPNDNIFGPQENMLQLSGPDSTLLGNPTRSSTLASFNLVASNRAAQIRQRLASTSWDLKSFGKEFLGVYAGTNDARRLWEFTDTSAGATGAGPFRFPPDVAVSTLTPAITSSTPTLYPLRLDLAHLLWTLADPHQQQGTNAQLLPQRPMSINHLVEQLPMIDPTTGASYTGFRFRPLTPHPTAVGSPPTSLANTPIPVPSHTTDGIGYTISTPEQLHTAGGTAQQQEWLARYDRQRLARDIYTLLYLTGGGNDAINYATTSNQPAGGTGPRPLYTDDQLREMAQFAVNLVDALDPDTNITVFEYDKDLSNGWNLNDNAYDNGAGDTVAPFSINLNDRGVVYGVERQQLAFNEAQVTFAECVNPASVPANQPIDHPDTQYNESLGYWSFFFAELENVSPFPVTFLNEGWQIAIKESPTVTPSLLYGQEMRMTIGVNQPDVQTGPNARFTIGTAGATLNGSSYVSNFNAVAATPFPSFFVVNPNDGDTTYTGPNVQFPIAPRSAYTGMTTPPNPNALSLDMIVQPNNCFVMPALSAGSPYSGPWIQGTAAAPAGTQFVQFINWPNILATSSITVRIELRRRADVNRLAPVLPTVANLAQNQAQEQDNPWIVVDYMDVPVSMLMLQPGNNFAQIRPQLTVPSPGGFPNPVASVERSQPLYQALPATGGPPTPNGGKTSDIPPTYQANSLGQDNDPPNAVLPHTLYQPLYDRDFSSIIELFNVPLWGPYGPGSDVAVSTSPNSGLAYRMASRSTDTGTSIAQETLAGGDWNAVAYAFLTASPPPPEVVGHSLGFGTAAYRFQHPEGGGLIPPNPVNDLTENRWHRLFGLVEVPTRSHRDPSAGPYEIASGSLGGPAGFYRTPGKINLNTLRYPDVLAGLLDEADIYTLQYSTAFGAGQNFPAGLSMPLSLQDKNGLDTFPAPIVGQQPSTMTGQLRDWWLQFIAARDGTDPLPTGSGGTGLALPGLPRTPSGVAPPAGGWNVPPGSHPFRGMGFSAYANGPSALVGGMDAGGYNGTLESNILRALPGDPATIPSGATPPITPDSRRRLLELGTAVEHSTDTIDYAVRNRVLSKILQNTTTRSNVFLVWIQIDYFQARDVNPPNGVVRIGAKLATSPAYRGFFVIDRSQAMSLMGPQFLPSVDPATGRFVFSMNQSFNYQSLVLFRQRIQ